MIDPELAEVVKSAIGYEPTRVSLSPGVGGLTHRTAEDRDWLVQTISDAVHDAGYRKVAPAIPTGTSRYPLTLDLESGKYTLRLYEGDVVTADRHGEPWRDFVGDKFITLLARKVFGLADDE